MAIKVGNGGRIRVSKSFSSVKIPKIGDGGVGSKTPKFAHAKFPIGVVRSATRRK